MNLYDGEEKNAYQAIAYDRLDRETDVYVHADSLEDAKNRVSDSMSDYRWTDVSPLSRKKSDKA